MIAFIYRHSSVYLSFLPFSAETYCLLFHLKQPCCFNCRIHLKKMKEGMKTYASESAD